MASTGDLDGSLFEGMVLFSPSDLLLSPSLPERDLSPLHLPPSPHSKSQPLDEDLFSNLSLETPIEIIKNPRIEIESPSPALPSRQISRKKKRALRIGYGREAIDATPAETADNHSHSTENADLSFKSDFNPSTTSFHQDFPNGSGHEDVAASEVVVVESVISTADGDGLSTSRRNDSEGGAVVLPSTLEASEKGDTLELLKERLSLLRSKISTKLEQIREMATSVYGERKELERRKRTARQDVNQASVMYKDLEKQLEVACEAEDFESAERISEYLGLAEKEKDRFLGSLRESELNCDYIDSRMQEVLKLQIAAEEDGIDLLELFAKDATDRADLICRNAEKESTKDLEDWQSSMELLEMSKLEMNIEVELVSDARSALDGSIEDLVKDDREEVEKLKTKQVILSKELDELLSLVRLKEAEIIENESQIHEVEQRISIVSSRFQESSSSVGLQHDSLKTAMSMIESELDLLSIKKNEIDEFISLEEQRSLNLRELASAALDEAKFCQGLVGLRKELASSILKYQEEKLQLVKTEEKILEEIQVLRQQISSARTILQELSSSRLSIQQDIDLFKQRIAFVDKRGPELEAEKKVAAATRNFKEAGRIAAVAKALNSEKDGVQSQLDKAVLNLEKIDEGIKRNISMMQESEELVLLKEREAAVASIKRLRLISSAARSESSAALELGDSEEGEFLFREAEVAEERAKEFLEAYSLDPDDYENTGNNIFPVALIPKFSGHSIEEMAAALKKSSCNL